MHKLWCVIVFVCSIGPLVSQPPVGNPRSREFNVQACMFEIGLCNPPPAGSTGGPACPLAAQIHSNGNGNGHQGCDHD